LILQWVSTIGDRNPISYDAGISVIRNILKVTRQLKKNPKDLNARGVILYGASIATSGRLGIGKEENYAYDIYELEFISKVLFHSSYRKSLTTLFPRFLKVMVSYYEKDICAYFMDVFGCEGDIVDSVKKMIKLFTDLRIDMYFNGGIDEERIKQVSIHSILKQEEIVGIIEESMR